MSPLRIHETKGDDWEVVIANSINPYRIGQKTFNQKFFTVLQGESGYVVNTRTQKRIPFDLGEFSVSVGDSAINIKDLRQFDGKRNARSLREKNRSYPHLGLAFTVLPLNQG